MKSPFQTILVVLFVVAFGGAVLVFSGLISFGTKKAANTTAQGTVEVWGILPQNLIQPYLSNFNISDQGYNFNYTERDPKTLEQDLTVALANNMQPDLVIFSSEIFSKFRHYLYVTPYELYSERAYRDVNIDGAQIFLAKDGIVALPLLVDPLVVYYNKDILAQASFVVPPKTWSVLQQAVPVLTKVDSKNNLTQSAISIGTAQNVLHVRDILSALFLQTGNGIVVNNPATDSMSVTLSDTPPGVPMPQTAAALEFYTSFSNPTNANYAWNNAQPSSLTMFLSGKSALYIGRASELFTIQAQNPNLNFDVSQIFQTDSGARPATYGSFIGVGIMDKAPNPIAARAASVFLSDERSVDALSKTFSLPPVHRSLLGARQANPYIAVFFNAALSAFAWPDPDPIKSEQIFRDMITGVTSGRTDATSAIYEASRNLQSLTR